MNLIRHIFLLLLLAIGVVSESYAITNNEIKTVQIEMLSRINNEVEAYATTINIDPEYIVYCRIEMNNKIDLLPKNGSVPFGVNYFQITDNQTLRSVIYNREIYEKSSIKLCLANVKKTLRDAK
jgi:hypothetical protein